jgi:serine/threonine protein kinase
MADAMLPVNGVDELAEEFARRLRAGEQPSVEEYARRHPERADEVRAVLAAVEMMEQLKPRREDELPRDTSAPQSGNPLKRIGDYRIVREIGRGGMGVVYEAEQEALGRRVALKVLPPHLVAEERSRSRFRRESQAAGRLHHTHIVPVFGAGEADGHCFYVMQLIDGRGLDQAIRATATHKGELPATDPDQTVDVVTPSPQPPASGSGERSSDATTVTPRFALTGLPARDYWRAAARIGSQVADALAYAHSQGVLHRDVKPSNLLLDAHGAVWVTDFGVAKLAEEAGLTQSGELVGTLKYMPPERFAGRTDARGDVYSLGMTLYEMLTLRPAFPDTNPQHLIRLIHEQPPPRPRAVNPGIPHDLETIVLKAIARDPAHRYATAEEMAADLRRFLDDRPILAKRAGPAERALRWCRRNPALAAAAGTIFLLLAVTAGVSFAAYLKTAAASREVEKALEAEKEQREHAEQTAALALAALNRTYDRFAPTRLVVTPQATGIEGVDVTPQPGLPPEAVPLLEDLQRTYEQLALSGTEFPRLRSQAAEANFRIGDIRQRLGRAEGAAAAFRAAAELYARLLEPGVWGRNAPNDTDEGEEAIRIKLARAHNERGRALRSLGKLDEAAQAHEQAIQALRGAPAPFARRPEARYELARSYFTLGQREMLLSEPPRGGPGRRGGPGGKPGPPLFRGKGPPPGGPGRNEPMRRAAELLERLVDEFPKVPEYRHLLACCLRDGPESWRGVELLRELVKEFPRVPDYRLDLCETLGALGPPHRGEAKEKRKRLEEAIALSRPLVDLYPNVPEYTAAHARYLDRFGLVLFDAGELDAAAQAHRKALDLQNKLVKQCPDVLSYTFWQCLMERALGRTLSERGKLTEGRALLESSIARAEALGKKDSRLVGVRPFLGMAYRDLARALSRAGKPEQAAEALRKAETFGPRPGGGGRPGENGRGLGL